MSRLACLVIVAACQQLGPLDVQTDHGVVRGADDGNGVRSFLGIPYAAPPVGKLRWRPPAAAHDWDGTRDGTKYGQKCIQDTVITPGGGTEDCLFLNVWTPSPQPVDAPVMVWIHGGAFIFGAGSDPFYAGSELARTRGVVVVTINYRLGALGFMAHPALSAEDSAHPASGNYGLLDQIAALEWVQRNIAAFGGNPQRVTVFGESAGGYSACLHYASPKTRDMIAGAISESGACTANALEQPRADAEASGVTLMTQLGCPGTDSSVLDCARAIDPYAILDALPVDLKTPGGALYGAVPASTLPNVDGLVLPASVETLLANGGGGDKPLIVGNNRDEGTLFHSSLLSSPVTTETDYRACLERRFGAANVDAIETRYPVSGFASPNDALAAVSGDAFFVCPARRNARAASAAGAPVYRYIFSRELEQSIGLGAFHSSEIPFVFGLDSYPLGKVGAGAPLADAMQGYWTRFAANGDPNGGELAYPWPHYDAGDPYLQLDLPIAAGSGYKAALCDFWDSLSR